MVIAVGSTACEYAASDNTDPRTNSAALPLLERGVASTALRTTRKFGITSIATYSLLIVMVDRFIFSRVRKFILVGVWLVVSTEAMCYVLLRSEMALAQAGQRQGLPMDDRRRRSSVIGTELDGMGGTGLSLNFAPHPFMNFIANPQAPYMGVAQIDKQSLIRRSEPLRPRELARWRALVLGGSTDLQ